MSFEALQAEISLLLTQMENQPQDAHELHEVIREKINEMRAYGMPVPEDLLELEKTLEADFDEAVEASKASETSGASETTGDDDGGDA